MKVEGWMWNSILSAAVLFPPPFFFHYSLPLSKFPPPSLYTSLLKWRASLTVLLSGFSPTPLSPKPCSVQSCFCHCSEFLSPPTHEQSILVRILKGGLQGGYVPCHYRRFPIGGSSLLTLIQFPLPIFFVFSLLRMRGAALCYITVIKFHAKATV